MLSKKLLLSSVAMLLGFQSYLSGEEPIQENPETSLDSHIPVRSREMDPMTRDKVRALRIKEHEEQECMGSEAAQGTVRRANAPLLSSGSRFKLVSQPAASASLPAAGYSYSFHCHQLMNIGANGRCIEMEDSSQWEVAASDTYVVGGWRPNDSLIITPNYSWFSSYDYCITNKSNNTHVKANMYVGPVAFGPYSHWIVDIDYFGGHVYLENQMTWCVNPADSAILSDWAVNDHIIIGFYDTWFSPSDHILINVNMDDHVRAKQY